MYPLCWRHAPALAVLKCQKYYAGIIGAGLATDAPSYFTLRNTYTFFLSACSSFHAANVPLLSNAAERTVKNDLKFQTVLN